MSVEGKEVEGVEKNNNFPFSDPNGVIYLIISIPLIFLDIRSVTALLATIHNVNVNYRSL